MQGEQFYSGTKIWIWLWLSHLVTVGPRVKEGILGERTCIQPCTCWHSTCVTLPHLPQNSFYPLYHGIVDWWERRCSLNGLLSTRLVLPGALPMPYINYLRVRWYYPHFTNERSPWKDLLKASRWAVLYLNPDSFVSKFHLCSL